MTFLTLAVVTLLGLAFESTRGFAVIGAGLLLYLYPFGFLALVLLGGAAFYFIRKRRSPVELPRLPFRRP